MTASEVAYFKSNTACCAVLTGLSKSLVLSTLPNPTLEALIPVAILAFVMAPLTIEGASAVPVKSPASLIFPLVNASASTTVALLLPPPTEITLST